MKHTAIVAVLGLLAWAGSGAAQQLPSVIEQNVKSAGKSAGELASRPAPKLWIHVRNDAQRREVDAAMPFFRGLKVQGAAVDVRPVQRVNAGPQRSELRVFNAADRAHAKALLTDVARVVPGVVLSDLSNQYKQAKWIEPGHFELWLAPGVTRLERR
jgi:hypothetical protein